MIDLQTTKNNTSSGDKAPSKLPAVAGLLVLASAAGFIGWGLYQAMSPTQVPVQGMMDAKTVSVAAKIPGRLEAIHVTEGDVVKAGDAVARIGIPEIEAKLYQAQALERAAAAKASLADEGPRTQQIDAAKADLTRARAGQRLAEATYRRIEALHKDGYVAEQKLDEARAARENARELTSAAQAHLSALEEGARAQEKDAAYALRDQAAGGVSEASSLASESDVKSPIEGEVTRVVMHEGEVVPAGFPLVMVTDLKDQWAVFNLREDELPGFTVGTKINVFIPALDKTADFTIYWINPRGSYATWRATRQSSGYDIRTFEVRARPDQTVADLRPGMTVVLKR